MSFRKVPRGLLSTDDYWSCFQGALKRMMRLRPGGRHTCVLNTVEHDQRITDRASAEDDFYSSFEYRRNGVLAYAVTGNFFRYSYKGFAPTTTRATGEGRKVFLKSCATNYLEKNFWHNHVHEQLQHITSNNYRQVRDEARYLSDFEADNLASVLLALSRGYTLCSDSSDQTARADPALHRLFLRNRSNKMFALREKARRKKKGRPTIDDLHEAEWLIRRNLANELGMYCLEHGRALASISVHFFGPTKRVKGRYERPNAQGCVELNGVRIPLGSLGNFAYVSRQRIKTAIESFVKRLDNEYSGLLRSNRALAAYARKSLESKVRRLVDRPLTSTAAGLRVK